MEKIDEFLTTDSCFKAYSTENLNVLEFITDIQNNGVFINYIEALEGVEADMQTVSGMRMNPAEFEQKYAEIEIRGRELSYYIDSLFGKDSVKFTLNTNTNVIVLNSDNQSLELEQMVSQKKTR